MIIISICLSDLPKDKIVAAQNGKKYINLVLSERKETGKFGETHTLYVSKNKDERNAPTVYVGSGKTVEFKQEAVTAETIDGLSAAEITDDLPF